MNFLMALIDGIGQVIRRNPITFLVIFVLAIAAPSLLKGVAIFIMYFILGIITLIGAVVLLFRWRVHKMRKQMGDQFKSQGGFGGQSGGFNRTYNQRGGSSSGRSEGDVDISKRADSPSKKVSSQVGDYVEFEETKD